ncbi:hypothetical protein TrLO_g1153 [Triparma laevis f. longispina]|uniref:Uncharacterized protein n=1 Tax=Triparma laevis f. longispina TaxID=1714387 RepID=A0A9W7KW09_9STRA|nr:hypothetical protein TrLO_g1153 [Triparma laevis f. longispina]
MYRILTPSSHISSSHFHLQIFLPRLLSSRPTGGPTSSPGISDSNAGVVSGPVNVAEAKISRWLEQGGSENLTGPGYKHDRFKDAAVALGKGDDYLHSKLLSDNSIKPLSVTSRKDYDTKLNTLKIEIKEYHINRGSPPLSDYILIIENKLTPKLSEINTLAKLTNDAIIADSLTFNGMSPVKHAKILNLVGLVRDSIQ